MAPETTTTTPRRARRAAAPEPPPVDAAAPARRAEAEERPLGELLAEATGELRTLFHKELELARVETKDQIAEAGRAGALLGATALVAFLAVLLLSFGAVWGLAEVVPTGVAFVVVGAVYAVLAALFFSQGRRRMAKVRPVPEQTIETLKEDIEWAKGMKQSA